MIKKAKVRFIVVTMTVIFVLLAAFFALGYMFLTQSGNRAVVGYLRYAEKAYRSGATELGDNIAVLSFPSGVITDNGYVVVVGEGIYPRERLDAVVQSAKSFSEEIGSANGLFYYFPRSGEDVIIFVADISESVLAKKTDGNTAIILLLVIYVILFFIVLGASYAIFQPVQDNFYRQKRFISDASHELRTPVAIISANADVLENYVDNDYLKSIKKQTKRLEALVSDMLTLARTEEEKISLKKEEVCLSDEVNEVILPYEAILFENGKTLFTDIAENVTAVIDRHSFKTVLGILIDNAVKHSADKAVIRVSLKKEASRAVLTVFNEGSGVLSQDSEKVFQRFYRSDESRSRDSGGSGLGLSIAKTVSEANKWKISAKSVYGVSMTITLIVS